jgi:hypothetical protein
MKGKLNTSYIPVLLLVLGLGLIGPPLAPKTNIQNPVAGLSGLSCLSLAGLLALAPKRS